MLSMNLVLILGVFLISCQGVQCVFQFSPPTNWTLRAAISDGGTMYYFWKPTCESGQLRIGDLVTTIDYRAQGQTPPSSMLYCVQDSDEQVSPANSFSVKTTFRNNLTNSQWQIIVGRFNVTKVTPGYFVRPQPPPPPPPPSPLSSLLSTLSTLLSNSLPLKRSVDTIQNLLQSSPGDDSYYGAFPNDTCFQPCLSSTSVYRISTLGFNLIVYNPFEFLGAFTANATLFIVSTNETIVPFCFTRDCVCDQCKNGGQCNQYGVCICPPQWNGTTCEEDVDECALQRDNCDSLVQCINYPGGYNCTPCPSGYSDVYGDGTYCVDIDECEIGLDNCSLYGLNCTNLPGRFNCTPCSKGFIETSSGCTNQYCGNKQLDNNTNEECDGGFRCLPNCTCDQGFTSTNPPSTNCTSKCGNGLIDYGEECDGGLGCNNSSCLCMGSNGFQPASPPNTSCITSSSTYFDSCQLRNESCEYCVSFKCLFCFNSGECVKERIFDECQTSCPSSPTINNNSNITTSNTPQAVQSPTENQSHLKSDSSSEDLIIALVVVAGVVVVGILVLVLYIYFHRSRKYKKKRDEDEKNLLLTQQSLRRSKYGVFTPGSLVSLTKEWTPPSDSNFVKLNKLPVKFSKELDFNLGKNQFRVNEPYIDVIVLTLKEDRKDEVYVEFHPSVNPRYEFVIEPQSVVVKKGKEVEVKFTLTVTMTTEVECPIAINLPHEKIHSKMIVNIVSELSPFIDFDELVIDSQKPIGDGGFGTVYRGQYRGTDAAIKILKIQDLPTELLEEFTREIDLMAKLRHKNIIQFLGASCVQGKFAIVTEFIELGSVSSVMKKEKFSYPLKLKIACDAARALSFLHKNKILHRDLKLENLLLVSMSLSAPVNAKLADFGTSRAVSEKTTNKYTTGIGTPIYMAPEILKREPYDLSSDIYSFGMMLWALMAEKEPWSQYTQPWEVANLVIEGKREVIPSEWTSEIADLIQRCWAQNPKERPEAKEIYQILQEITSKELEKYNIGVPGETPRDNEFSKPQQTSSSSQIPNDSSQTTTSKNQSNEGVK